MLKNQRVQDLTWPFGVDPVVYLETQADVDDPLVRKKHLEGFAKRSTQVVNGRRLWKVHLATGHAEITS